MELSYTKIEGEVKKHLTKLLLWLLDEVASAGGDGDAFWICKYYDLNEVESLAKELLIDDKFWILYRKSDTELHIGVDQEWLIITKDLNYHIPTWAQCYIKT